MRACTTYTRAHTYNMFASKAREKRDGREDLGGSVDAASLWAETIRNNEFFTNFLFVFKKNSIGGRAKKCAGPIAPGR